MKINPIADVWDFLVHGGAVGLVFWLLLVLSVGLAGLNLRRHSDQRTWANGWNWFVRIAIGGLWWQQSLWKMPPTYGVAADGTGGLQYWMEQMVQFSCVPLQARMVENVMLPHFSLFAPQIYMGEVLIAALLMLGLFGRVAALLGAAMSLNLWLGLYRSPSEWIWAYFFMIVIHITFLALRPGLSWGADSLLRDRNLGAFEWIKRLA